MELIQFLGEAIGLAGEPSGRLPEAEVISLDQRDVDGVAYRRGLEEFGNLFLLSENDTGCNLYHFPFPSMLYNLGIAKTGRGKGCGFPRPPSSSWPLRVRLPNTIDLKQGIRVMSKLITGEEGDVPITTGLHFFN